jgi:16S rRNA (cytosine1402-N4)-methyltransferase
VEYTHVTVLKKEAVQLLDPKPGQTVADGTLGGGGHAEALLERVLPGGLLVGMDRDTDAIENARARFAAYGGAVRLFHGNYSGMRAALDSFGIPTVNAIVLDLGLSQHHITESGRGFSFLRPEILDMRMDASENGPTAGEIVNTWEPDALADIFFKYGEERYSRRMARLIAEARKRAPIRGSLELAEIVSRAVPRRELGRIHPATRIFQSLRVVVNNELRHLESFLADFLNLLAPGGRLCVIAFHSLEDRLVKRRFRELAGICSCPPGLPVCGCGMKSQGRVLTRRAVCAGPDETAANPQARSARLRAFEKADTDSGGTGSGQTLP